VQGGLRARSLQTSLDGIGDTVSKSKRARDAIEPGNEAEGESSPHHMGDAYIARMGANGRRNLRDR